MAIKRVVLHLGMPKTGSSSIQHTLFSNFSVLEKNGFRYLTEWDKNHLNKFGAIFTGKKESKNLLKKLSMTIETSESETLILSGEYFHTLYRDSTIKNIREFIKENFLSKGIETTIVYFVRNPLTWIISWWQQRLYRDGYKNKNCDFFEFAIKQYEGIFNLKKHFSDSLTILKFEDACLDRNGLVEYFLMSIGYPRDALKNLTIIRTNDSRCMEVVEFISYIESVEPRYPFSDYKRENPKKAHKGFKYLKDIKGVKFDFSYQSKSELWERLKNTINLLKEKTGIDYTDYNPVEANPDQETYSEETIQGFIEAFPKLSPILQKLFLKFFEKKYMETAQEKYKKLHFNDSVPYMTFISKSQFLKFLLWNIKWLFQKFKRNL